MAPPRARKKNPTPQLGMTSTSGLAGSRGFTAPVDAPRMAPEFTSDVAADVLPPHGVWGSAPAGDDYGRLREGPPRTPGMLANTSEWRGIPSPKDERASAERMLVLQAVLGMAPEFLAGGGLSRGLGMADDVSAMARSDAPDMAFGGGVSDMRLPHSLRALQESEDIAIANASAGRFGNRPMTGYMNLEDPSLAPVMPRDIIPGSPVDPRLANMPLAPGRTANMRAPSPVQPNGTQSLAAVDGPQMGTQMDPFGGGTQMDPFDPTAMEMFGGNTSLTRAPAGLMDDATRMDAMGGGTQADFLGGATRVQANPMDPIEQAMRARHPMNGPEPWRTPGLPPVPPTPRVPPSIGLGAAFGGAAALGLGAGVSGLAGSNPAQAGVAPPASSDPWWKGTPIDPDSPNLIQRTLGDFRRGLVGRGLSDSYSEPLTQPGGVAPPSIFDSLDALGMFGGDKAAGPMQVAQQGGGNLHQSTRPPRRAAAPPPPPGYHGPDFSNGTLQPQDFQGEPPFLTTPNADYLASRRKAEFGQMIKPTIAGPAFPGGDGVSVNRDYIGDAGRMALADSPFDPSLANGAYAPNRRRG